MTPLLTEVLRKAPPAPPIKRQRVEDKHEVSPKTAWAVVGFQMSLVKEGLRTNAG